jgi:nucleotide-binding universal stress UspA family protein
MDPSPAKILVATDLSPSAGEALRQAGERARSTGARLGVCLAIPGGLGVHPLFPQVNQAEAESLGDRRLQAEAALREQVLASAGDYPVELFIEPGWPHAQVLRLAEEWAADLVVVGSQGAAALADVLLGSTAERIVRHAPCPVLVARPPRARGRIVIGTDFSDPALPAVRAGAAEARRTGAKITLLHAIEDSFGPALQSEPTWAMPWIASPEQRREAEEAALLSLAEAMAIAGASGDLVVRFGDPASQLIAAATEGGAELLVVGTAGRTGLRRVLLGSVAEKVARLAPCSVEVVRLAV